MIGSAACGSSSIIVRPSGPAPASANTSIRSPARSREPAATQITAFSSSWKDRVPARLGKRAARRADCRSAHARRRAQLRVAPAALAPDRSTRRRRVRHRALTASAAAAVALGGADRDHSRSAFSVASGADIRGDSPRLSRSRPRPRPPRRSHHRRLAIRRRRGAARARHCRQIAFRSVPNGAPEWNGPAAVAECGRLPAVRRHDRATQECRRAARRVRAAARTPGQCSTTRYRRTRGT